MSKNLKKIFITGAALLMFASVGASANSTNVSARHVRTHKVVNNVKRNKKNIKTSKSRKAKKGHRNHKQSTRLDKRTRKINNKRKDRKSHRRYRKYNAKRLNKNQLRRLAKKARRKSHRNKKAKRNNKVLKSRYRRSNNKRLLKKSGFINLSSVLADTPGVQSKYAPNSRDAVIPKDLNINGDLWLQARVPQLHPILYQYVSARHGWVKLGNL